jgi:hypothetical protein
MQPISSKTTGLAMERSSSTGKQPGATGSGALTLPDLEQTYVIIPPHWLSPIVNDQLSYLVSSVNMGRQLPGSLTRDEAKQSLTHALALVRGAFAPASPQEITSSLEVVAEVFRAQLPEKQAFKLYVAVLQDLPAVAFKEACRQIVRTHRYPNLPLPAEFIEAAQPIIKQMNGWKQRLELAVSRV